MRTLLAMRHAKSDWNHTGLSDHDRPLNERGTRDAPRMGRWLQAHGCTPDVIAASTALRAQTTAALVAEASELKGSPRPMPEFYLASPGAYLDWFLSLDEDVGCAMVVGHNPGMEELIERITSESHAMPTAAIGVIRILSGTWEDFAMNPKAQLETIWTPKGLPEDFA